MGNAAAASSKRISRTQYDRIANRIGKAYAVFYIMNHQRSRAWLSDFFHRIFKCLAILRFENRLGRRSNQLYAMLFQKAGLCQLHAKI